MSKHFIFGYPYNRSDERCPHCSAFPTTLNDHCDVHRPDWTLKNLITKEISLSRMARHIAIGEAAAENALVGKKIVKAVKVK